MQTDRLIGGDFSHHNKYVPDGLTFYFLKATEGKNHVDNVLEDIMVSVWNERVSPIYGFYHFARPDLDNTYAQEAEHYINTIKPHIGACLMALDVEGKAVNYPIWVKGWLDYVYKKTCVKPFLYMSASYVSAWKQKHTDIVNTYPIWVAQYGKEETYKDLKKTGTIWQFTSSPFDLDMFYGTREELAAYAIPVQS